MRVFTNGRGMPPPINSNTLHQWNFDETSSSNSANDSVRTGYDQTNSLTGFAQVNLGPQNSPTVVTSASSLGGSNINGARRLNGSTQYFAQIGTTPEYDQYANFTLIGSVRLASGYNANGVVCAYGTTGTTTVFRVMIDSNKKFNIIWNTGAGGTVTLTSGIKLPDCKWINFAVVRSTSGTSSVKLFLWGSLAENPSTWQGLTAATTTNSSQAWFVGRSNVSSTEFFNGDLSTLTIYKAALSDSTVEDYLRTMMLFAAETSIHTKVEVADNGGTLRDLTNLFGVDWVTSVNIKDDSDAPIGAATVVCVREYSGNGFDEQRMSLGKYNNNRLNRVPITATGPDAQTYSASTELLALTRRIVISQCRLPFDLMPSSTDWMTMFDGYIDTVDWGGEGDRLVIEARDKGSKLMDCYVQSGDPEKTYGSDPAPIAVQTVMGSILTDANSLWGAPSVTLKTSGVSAGVGERTINSPNWNLRLFALSRQPVMQALNMLAEQFGWTVRYRWNYSTQAFELTLYEPDRIRVHCDAVLSIDNYFSIDSMRISVDTIRTKVRIVYPSIEANQSDATANLQSMSSGTSTATPGTVTWKEAPEYEGSTIINPGLAYFEVTTTDLHSSELGYNSVNEYGVRFCEVAEAATSNINTAQEAQAMGVAILRDLCYPKAEAGMNAMPFIEFESGDFIRLRANRHHFTSDQDMSIIGVDAKYERDMPMSSFQMRGLPSGGTQNHMNKEARPGNAMPPLLNHNETGSLTSRRQRKFVVDTLSKKTSHLRSSGSHTMVQNGDFANKTFGINPPDGWRMG